MKHTKPAFSLIEIVVVLFLVVVIVPAINSIISQSVRTMAHTQREVEALYLAQEGMEALRAYRDSDWQNLVDLEENGMQDYLNLIEGNIEFSTTSVLIDSQYTREIEVNSVCRDGWGDIADCPSITEDEKTKKVDVIVSWDDVYGIQEMSLSTYLTAFRGTE